MSTTSVNLDTSVLVNYVYSSLPVEIEPDKGSQALIDDNTFRVVIGGKAESEFLALCDRRYTLYEDVVSFLLEGESDHTIFEYEPRDRDIPVSENDRNHFRKDIQMSWYDLDKRDQLSVLRRCIQDFELYQLQLDSALVDDCYDKQENPDLLEIFREELSIGHDCEILVDAIEISRNHSVETLVAIDSHITQPGTAEVVADAIDRVLDSTVILEIVEPNGIVASD